MTAQTIALDNGWQLAVFETASSTSDILFSSDTLTEGQAVLAREQTKGRGRHGRDWTSLRDDGMYLSLALRPKREVQEWPSLSFVAALCLLQAISECAPDCEIGLKWPNDVLLAGGKISGLLLEARGEFVVIGCGVNLKNAPPMAEAPFAPTDLYRHTGKQILPETLAQAFLKRFYPAYQNWQATGFSTYYDLYKAHLLMLGEMITVKQAKGPVAGIMRDISRQGHLLLEDEAGNIKEITTGDVALLGLVNAVSD